jgi:hypothetical protein
VGAARSGDALGRREPGADRGARSRRLGALDPLPRAALEYVTALVRDEVDDER